MKRAIPSRLPKVRTFAEHIDVVNTVAWSPNGNSIATGSADNTVRVREVATGKQMYAYRGHSASVNSIV